MPPFVAFLLGALAGAVGTAFAPELQRNARPLLKEAIKLGILFGREAQLRTAELIETIEDAYAEASAEAERSGLATPALAAPTARPRRSAGARKTAAKKTARPAAKRRSRRTAKSTAGSTAAGS